MGTINTENIILNKAKISKESYLDLEFSETIHVKGEDDKTDTITRDVMIKSNQLVHPDLIDAFNGLIWFMVDICELPNVKKDKDGSWGPYKVTGFVISGMDDQEGVVLIGQKKLAGNRVLNIITPFVKFENENEPYSNGLKLRHAIDTATDEVLAFINGKSTITQLELELDLDN